MRRRSFLLGVPALVLLAGCSRATTASGGFVGGDGTLTRVPVASRQPAPRVTGELLDGTPFDSADLAGQVIVYNVWGSWCNPCRAEAPALVAASASTTGTATFVGLNTRDPDPAQAQAFVRTFEVPYANVYDPDGRELLKFGTQLPPSAIPSTLVVDAEGRIAARVLGETTQATLEGLVADVAAGR